MKNIAEKKSSITAQDVANYFIAFANVTGDLLTNLKLQKLVYYAQAWNIAVNHTLLFDDDFEAWVHGPVIRELYFKFKDFGSKPIIDETLNDKTLTDFEQKLPKASLVIFDDIKEVYFPQTAYRLEQMTHEEMPWLRARKGLQPHEPSSNIIEKSWMEEFYTSLV